MSLIALKSRKKTIDMIYRASCAMKAAAVVRVRKVEKCLADFANSSQMIDATENRILEYVILGHIMNKNAVCKVNIIIACDKGMCGDFMNKISAYFKYHKNNGDYWLVFGSKLESACANNERTLFFGNTFLDQMELFKAVSRVSDFLKNHSFCEMNLHYFSKDKVVVKQIVSKQRVLDAVRENLDEETKAMADQIPSEYAQILLARYLYSAMLSSMLEENIQRLVAMTQAKTNAEDMGKLIARLYNKARQEKITLELNEITAGIV